MYLFKPNKCKAADLKLKLNNWEDGENSLKRALVRAQGGSHEF